MISLYDHIQQLRAELKDSYLTRCERVATEAALGKAIAQLSELDRELDDALDNVFRELEPPG